MAKLTSRREKFAQCVASGMNLSEAYRAAYKTDRMKPESVNNSAYVLSKNIEITSRIDQLRNDLVEKQLWSREDSVRTLMAVIETDGSSSARIAAVKELNAMHGYNAPHKHRVEGAVILEVVTGI